MKKAINIHIPKFENYIHLRNYCFKVWENKGYKISDVEKSIFDEFEEVVVFLNHTEEVGIICVDSDFYKSICYMAKTLDAKNVIDRMKMIVDKLDLFKNGDIKFNLFLNEVNMLYGVDVYYRELFLKDHIMFKNRFYPDKVNVLEIKESNCHKIYGMKVDDLDFKNRFGVYFIYDSNGEIAYIGKSTNCILCRSIQSASERSILNFSKIELRECRSKSDVSIYESYYIGKFKPRCNSDLIFEDCVTVSLEELPLSKCIERDFDKHELEYSFTYYRVKEISIDEYLKNENDNFILKSNNIIKEFLDNGIGEYRQSQEIAYYKKLEEAKNDNFYNLTRIIF